MNSEKDLFGYNFIVVGTEHFNPLGVVRSLGLVGINSILIVKERDKYAPKVVSVSKYASKVHMVKTFEHVADLIVRTYGDSQKKNFLYVCDDSASRYLDSHYSELKGMFYMNNCGDCEQMTYYMNKCNMNEIARTVGFNVPKSWECIKGIIPEDVVYPVITKPISSYDGWKRDYYLCYSRDELSKALEHIKGNVFLQQFIKKKNEYDVEGFSINRGRDVFTSIALSYTYLMPDTYSAKMEIKNVDAELSNKIEKLLENIKYEGIFSVDFLIDENDDYWFLEVNYRNSAWSWASTCLGMNLPYYWAQSLIYGKIPSNYKNHIPDHYIAIAEPMDYDYRVRKNKFLSFSNWIKEIKDADCLYIYDKNDIKPALHIWGRKITNIMARKLKGLE